MTRGRPNKLEDILSNYAPIPDTGCWIWLGGLDYKGYGRVTYQGKTTRVHEFFYSHFVGPIVDDKQHDHICKVRCCCNPDHVIPATLRENLARAGLFKLTDEQVEYIRTSKLSAVTLALELDVSRSYIYNIRSGRYRPQPTKRG